MTPGCNPTFVGPGVVNLVGVSLDSDDQGRAGTEGDSANEVMAGVLDSLRQSRAMLLDPCPRNLDRCRLAVAQGARKIGTLFQGNRAGWSGDELRESLLLVRRELSAITGLLDSAAAFRRDMLKAIFDATPRRASDMDVSADQKARRVHVLG